MPDQAEQDTLLSHLQILVGERHPISSPAHLQEVEEYLADTFAQLGLQVSAHPFVAWGATYRNVVASLLPTRRARSHGHGVPDAPLLLAAHYDTVEGSPGADDNASALTVLLDVARRLRDVDRSREVQFVGFCLEEAGLLGSRAYAAELRAAKRDLAGALVLECVGFASDQEGSQMVPPGIPITVPTVGNFLAIVGNTASASLTDAVMQAATPHLPVVPLTVPENGHRLPDTRRSDHAAFWDHGFSAVMLTDTADFRNPHYHRPTDRVETLNLTFLADVVDAVTAVSSHLAGGESGKT